MPDSSDVDAALSAKLLGDVTLMALMTDGVWFDSARQDASKFVIISLITEFDTAMLNARAFEDATYLVKAVAKSTEQEPLPAATIKSAAARIDVLLDGQQLVVPGYKLMVMQRIERIRYLERDEVNSATSWHHRGGRYQVMVSPS